MAAHIIPEPEKDLHTESQNCICEPKLVIDEETGEMVWVHKLVDPEGLLDDFIIL